MVLPLPCWCSPSLANVFPASLVLSHHIPLHPLGSPTPLLATLPPSTPTPLPVLPRQYFPSLVDAPSSHVIPFRPSHSPVPLVPSLPHQLPSPVGSCSSTDSSSSVLPLPHWCFLDGAPPSSSVLSLPHRSLLSLIALAGRHISPPRSRFPCSLTDSPSPIGSRFSIDASPPTLVLPRLCFPSLIGALSFLTAPCRPPHFPTPPRFCHSPAGSPSPVSTPSLTSFLSPASSPSLLFPPSSIPPIPSTSSSHALIVTKLDAPWFPSITSY